MTSPTAEQLKAAIAENDEAPEGPDRTARAEQLVARAESAGERDLLVGALLSLVSAYDGGSELEKVFPPFVRLLRMWDEQPDDFDSEAKHRLHRSFRRVVSGMLGRPHIPLESVREWQAQMAPRYRQAGYSQRAVHQSEFTIARETGDAAVADRAHAAWLAADRDSVSDCHACELQQQGRWLAHRGDDEGALRIWRPVLDGETACPHGPGAVLASSLLPLLRLGRLDEARSHHVRGYRMVRDGQGTHDAVADHVVFCALTGNEPRGLEILAEQGDARWEASGAPRSRLAWAGAVALLMRRLTELGQDEQRVPGPPGREWNAVTLLEHAADQALEVAARFDERNGNSAVSDEARTRMGMKPLADRLPLGLRTAPLEKGTGTASAPPKPATGVSASPSGGGPKQLLAEARRFSEEGHPQAPAAWQRLEDALTATGATLRGVDRAELLDHGAMRLARTDPAAGAARFEEAAKLFSAAGDRGQSVACRARAALATAFAGQLEEALDRLQSLCGEAASLHSAQRAGTKHATAVLLSRTRVRFMLLDDAEDPRAAADELDAELRDLISFAWPHRSDPAVLARIADATESQGRLAAALGDTAGATELLTEAARLYHDSGRPWQATGPELLLAQGLLQAGEAAESAALLLRALKDPQREPVRPAAESADLHVAVADAYAAQDLAREEAGHLLEAAQWADAAGDGGGLGAYVRLRLGGAYLALARLEEAAAVLESAMADLTAGHPDADVVQARWWLGEALTGTGEYGAAAGQFLKAARLAEGWDDQRDHAVLTHLAADALKEAGSTDEAVRAYERVEELWKALGDTPALVRSLRSRAWITIATPASEGEASVGAAAATAATKAVELMAAALRSLESGLQAPQDAQERLLLQLELGQTYRQTAELLLQTTDGPPDEDSGSPEQNAVNRAAYQEAVSCTDRAVTVFRGCGQDALDDRTSAELMAAWLELSLGRGEAAARRARSVLEAYPQVGPGAGETEDEGADVPVARAAEAASVLAAVGAPEPGTD